MDIFNTSQIYKTIFLNIQSVTEYGDLKDFEAKDKDKYETWKRMAEKRYKSEIKEGVLLNKLYLEKACFLPEFSKIVGITYATITTEKNVEQKRNLKRVEGETEVELIKGFCDMLQAAFSFTHQAKEPPYILCGHNIIGHDIPLLIKRIIKHRESLKNDETLHVIPKLLKNYVNAKPWDSYVVADFMGLKKSVKLLPKDEINKLYWTGIEDDRGSTMKEINTQSANFTNVVIQLVNELRQL